MPTNTAAYIETRTAHPLVVREAPYKSPGKGQVLIKAHAVAMNPIDWKLQAFDLFKAEYPLIIGEDVAGEVVAVGEGVSAFKPGDRVFAFTRTGFQTYSLAPATLTGKIPDDVSYEKASVIGVSVATAASALYQKDFLGLDLPSLSIKSNSADGTVIIWGGSSSCGSSAIQLAKASGYEVITTASKRNLSYAEDLGADKAIDYSNGDVVEEIVKALQGKHLAGCFDAISSEDTVAALSQIIDKHGEGSKKIAGTDPGAKVPHGSPAKYEGVFAYSISENEIGPAVINDFTPEALAAGKFIPKPDVKVIGEGLEKIQEGIDELKAGVSAVKLVVKL